MKTFDFYNDRIPPLLAELAGTAEMQRLKNVGMNCGCEYTSFRRFTGIGNYSRFTHSMGTGLITLHFTNDETAAASALLHDIATPVFAHTIDFMNGDHLLQESTESRTSAVISSSDEICSILSRYDMKPEDVWDYHRYPIADNDTPRLSADRLEYTLGNGVNYSFIDEKTAEELYFALIAGKNEDGEEELVFSDPVSAERFAFLALDCAKVYVSPEDRYSMQMLSELLKEAVDAGAILPADLELDEPALIKKLTGDARFDKKWKDFRSLSEMIPAGLNPERDRIIPAKKRRIDPLVNGKGRVSKFSSEFRTALDEFLDWDFSVPIAGR